MTSDRNRLKPARALLQGLPDFAASGSVAATSGDYSARFGKFTLARLMGHSSPRVAERYYIHVTEPHVMTGFERFLTYHAGKLVETVPKQTERVQ
jgi:hypothetical protein